MKLRKDLKLHVLVGRGWVEIRSGRVPPKQVTTHHQKTIVETFLRQSPNWPYSDDIEVQRPHTIDLITTTWTGGRTIGAMRLPTLRNLHARMGRLTRDTCRTFEQDSPAGRAILKHLEAHAVHD